MANTPTPTPPTTYPNTVTPSNTINDLPLKGNKKAPKTFTGDYRKVKEFFANIETLCHKEGVTSSKEKCKAVARYSSREVVSVIKGLESYRDDDYATLKKDLIFMYDGDRTEVEYSLSDVQRLIKRWNKSKINDLPTFKEYYKEFQKVVGWMHIRKKVSKENFNLWFWAGLPRGFRRKVEVQLRIEDPTLDVSVPFEIPKITGVVQKMYARDRFENQIPLMVRGRHGKIKKEESEESDSEEESESGSSSEESDEELPIIPERIKEPSKPKKRAHFVEEKKGSKERVREKEESKDESPVGTLIRQMKTLNLSDPSQRAFWVEAHRMYPEISERIREQSAYSFHAGSGPTRDTPPHMSGNARYIPNNDTGSRYVQKQCYGCGEAGHTMTRCGKIQELADEKAITKGVSGKWTWMDGAPISWKEGETLVDAVRRNLKHTGLVMVTPRQKKSRRDTSEESSEDEEEIERRKETYFSWHGTRSNESSTASDPESSDGSVIVKSRRAPLGVTDREALAAERSPNTNKSARYRPNEKENSQRTTQRKLEAWAGKEGPGNVNSIPIRDEVRRHFGNDRNGRGGVAGVPGQGVINGKEDGEGEPMAVDEKALKDRKENVPKDGRRHQGEMGRESGQVRSEMGEIASELVEGIMKENVTLQLGRLLKIAPDLQRSLARAAKGSLTRAVSEPSQKEEQKAAKLVRTNPKEKEVYLQEGPRTWGMNKPREELPTVEARVGRAKMTAIIDTGAMVSIISERMFKRTGLPKSDETLQLRDVNGGSKGSSGKIEMAEIYLTPKKHITIGDLWVLDTEKFDLLLGREWQTINMTGIQEKPEGTVLRFLSQGSYYEVNVSPADSEEEDEDGMGRGRRRKERSRQAQLQRSACVVQVEEGIEGKKRDPRPDAQQAGLGVGERDTRGAIERSGRSWTLGEDQSDLETQQRKKGGISSTSSRGDEKAYLEEGEIEELEPGGNKLEVIEATPEQWSGGSDYDEADKGGVGDEEDKEVESDEWEGDGEWYTDEEEDAESSKEDKEKIGEWRRRKRAREESSEEDEMETDSGADDESDYWRRSKSVERRKRKKKKVRIGKRRTETEVSEIQKERLIQTILTGGASESWDRCRDKGKRRTYSRHPWTDWLSDELRTEDESSSQSSDNETMETRNKFEDWKRPPNNQEELARQRTEETIGKTKKKDKEMEVRRST